MGERVSAATDLITKRVELRIQVGFVKVIWHRVCSTRRSSQLVDTDRQAMALAWLLART